MTSGRAVVIRGGPGAEHEVSLASGRAITGALRDLGWSVDTCEVSLAGAWRTGGRPGIAAALEVLAAADVAVPALHGPWGEDGTVQGFLETVGVPYVGSGVAASATCMDKQRTKLVLAAAGIPVAAGRTVGTRVGPRDAAALVGELGLPLFVKPVRGGSSYGVARVTCTRDLPEAITGAAAFSDDVLVEAELRGREIDAGVLVHPDGTSVVAPLLEIHADPAEPFFSTAAKYGSDRTRFLVPAPVDPGLAGELSALALRAFDALGCEGLARVDFIVDEHRGPVVNEVNTFPGFTEHSQFPRMWRAAGVSFGAVVGILVDRAVARRALGIPA